MSEPAAGSAPASADAQALQRLLERRHSCRGFLPDALPRATIESIARLAQRTASWCNAQPWQLHVADAPATERLRAALAAHLRTHAPKPDFDWPQAYEGIYRTRRRTCGFALYEAVGIGRDDKDGAERQRMANFAFFGAPHVAIVTTEQALGTYGAVDAGAYVAQFMLAAAAHEVDTIAQAALASYPDFWREAFALPATRRVVCGISMGRGDPSHPANGFRTERAPVNEAVGWLAD